MALSKLSMRKKPIALTFREFSTLQTWGMPAEVSNPHFLVLVLSRTINISSVHSLLHDRACAFRLHLIDLISQETPRNSPKCKRAPNLAHLDVCNSPLGPKKLSKAKWPNLQGKIAARLGVGYIDSERACKDLKLLDVFAGKKAMSIEFGLELGIISYAEPKYTMAQIQLH